MSDCYTGSQERGCGLLGGKALPRVPSQKARKKTRQLSLLRSPHQPLGGSVYNSLFLSLIYSLSLSLSPLFLASSFSPPPLNQLKCQLALLKYIF